MTPALLTIALLTDIQRFGVGLIGAAVAVAVFGVIVGLIGKSTKTR